MRSLAFGVVIKVVLLLYAVLAHAAGPLANLPSRPGPHVQKLRALDEDSWLELGVPEADPDRGTARGRAYSPKMAAAAELLPVIDEERARRAALPPKPVVRKPAVRKKKEAPVTGHQTALRG